MWLEMNCAVVWEDVDIRVMHSSEKHSPVFCYCVAEMNVLRKMLHQNYQNNELPALLETMWGKACNGKENKYLTQNIMHYQNYQIF
jgi:hypothetical protein